MCEKTKDSQEEQKQASVIAKFECYYATVLFSSGKKNEENALHRSGPFYNYREVLKFTKNMFLKNNAAKKIDIYRSKITVDITSPEKTTVVSTCVNELSADSSDMDMLDKFISESE